VSDGATQVAVLTPPGRGAVAVVAVRGPAATSFVENYFHAANGRSLDQQPLLRIVFGHWESKQGEELVVCRRSADEIEIHCHGGPQAARRIVQQLCLVGCEPIDWQQSIAGSCPIAAEAHRSLAQAQTSRAAAILLDQYHGALRKQIVAIQTELKANDVSTTCEQLAELLARSPLGLHLTEPWNVVIAGKPNVGKSSLLNALAGYDWAIVFDQPGTTRDVISANTALEGWPVRLSDTAGLHATSDPIEQAGIDRARQQLACADLVVWLVDCRQDASEGVSVDLSRRLVVGSKIDLRESTAETCGDFDLLTSSLTGEGIEQLVQGIAARLVPQSPSPGCAVPFTLRQVELLRTALQQCRQGDSEAAGAVLDRLLTCDG